MRFAEVLGGVERDRSEDRTRSEIARGDAERNARRAGGSVGRVRVTVPHEFPGRIFAARIMDGSVR